MYILKYLCGNNNYNSPKNDNNMEIKSHNNIDLFVYKFNPRIYYIFNLSDYQDIKKEPPFGWIHKCCLCGTKTSIYRKLLIKNSLEYHAFVCNSHKEFTNNYLIQYIKKKKLNVI